MGSFSTSRVSVGTSATLLWGGDVVAVEVVNCGSAAIDIGDSSVTSGAGRPLQPGEAVSLEMEDVAFAGYGIAASGTVSVAVSKVQRS